MRHILRATLLLLCLSSSSVVAKDVGSATYPVTFQNAVVANGNGTVLQCGGLATVVVQITGMTNATCNFEAAAEDSVWTAVDAVNVSTKAVATTSTGNGVFYVSVGGWTQFRCRISAYIAGTITVTGVGSTVPSSILLTTAAGLMDTNLKQLNGNTVSVGNGVAGTGTLRVSIASDSTGQVTLAAGSATIGALTANQSVNTTQLAGNAINLGTGTTGTGTQRVVIATDQPQLTNKLLVTPDANSAVNVAQVNGVATSVGNGVSGTGVQRVTIASDSTGQVALAAGSATIGALTANQSVNVAQMNGVTVTMGNGVAGTGVQRVTIASDSTGQVTLATGSNTIGALTANQSVNLAQIAGTTTLTGNGVAGAGAQRVTIASDNTAFAVNNTNQTGSNLIGGVVTSPFVSTVGSANGTTQTATQTFANVAASQTDASLVSGTANQIIRVLGVVVMTGGTATNVTFNTKPAGAGTAISMLFACGANGGAVLPFSSVPWFQTSTGDGLTVTTGAGSTTGIQVIYVKY